MAQPGPVDQGQLNVRRPSDGERLGRVARERIPPPRGPRAGWEHVREAVPISPAQRHAVAMGLGTEKQHAATAAVTAAAHAATAAATAAVAAATAATSGGQAASIAVAAVYESSASEAYPVAAEGCGARR